MSNKQTVIDFVRKLPEGFTLQEIAREVELFAGTREELERREEVFEEVEKTLAEWAEPAKPHPHVIATGRQSHARRAAR
ncbi:MAG: hypothetical protein AB1705_20445 [Verrucomicrobiota bacterium]